MSNKTTNRKQRSGNQRLWWTGKKCGAEGAKVLASMLLMQVPLTTLDLSGKITTLLDMILKEQKKNEKTRDCVVQITRSVMKGHEN